MCELMNDPHVNSHLKELEVFSSWLTQICLYFCLAGLFPPCSRCLPFHFACILGIFCVTVFSSVAGIYLRIFSSGVTLKCIFSLFSYIPTGLDGLEHAEFLDLTEFEKH